MTLQRFKEYVAFSFGGAILFHLLITETLIEVFLGYPNASKTHLPFAVPIQIAGALCGIFIVWYYGRKEDRRDI